MRNKEKHIAGESKFEKALNEYIDNRKSPAFKRIAHACLDFIRDMRFDYLSQYAAQATFFTVLSAVPFLMLVIFCLKYFVSVDIIAITHMIENSFPPQVSLYLSQIVKEVFFRSESMAALSFTIITVLWSSSRGIMAVFCGMSQIYDEDYIEKYNWFTARISSLFYNIIMIAVIVATVVVLIFGNTIAGFIGERFKTVRYVVDIIMNFKVPIFLILFIIAFTSLYTFLPQGKRRFRDQIPGAFMTAVGWLGFSFFFSLYIEHVAKYSVIYGSLSAIILLMLWFYVSIYMLLVGAELNVHLEDGKIEKNNKQ